MIRRIEPADPPPPAAVCGLFRDCASADKAWDASASLGYGPADVSIVVSEGTKRKHRLDAGKPAAGGKAGVCGMLESTVGGIASVLGAVGTSFLIPEFGVIVAGPLANAIVKAQEGRALDALIQGMGTLGIPAGRLDTVERHVRRGGIVLVLKPRSGPDAKAIAEDWKASALEIIS